MTSARAALLVLLGLVLPVAPATADIQDGDLFIVTTAGLYRVVPVSPAVKVLDPSAVGLTAFEEPSVTWIPRTDSVLVTVRSAGVQGLVLRIDLGPATPVVEDLTDLFGVVGLDPVDADACPVTDRLFLLDRQSGQVFVIDDPGTPASLDSSHVSVYATTTLDGPKSVAVDSAAPNEGVVVVGRFDVHRHKPNGTVSVLSTPASGTFQQVTANPITGEEYLADAVSGVFGKLVTGGIGSAILNMNASALCWNPVQEPSDVIWNADDRRMYALAEGGVTCLFGGIAAGQPHHVVRFPLAIGPVEPELLTSVPPAIEGTDGDLAVVRWGEPRIALVGDADPLLAGGKFTWDNAGYQGEGLVGQGLVLQADGGPPNALAALVSGFALVPVPLATGTELMPDLSSLAFLALDGAGDVSIQVEVPNDPVLSGLRVWLQWWVDDSAAAGGPRWAHSRAAGYLIGD